MEKIIPYDYWINSQLSIARHYGSITLDTGIYIVDWIFAKEDKDGKCKPDLIEEKTYDKMLKERKKEVQAYYNEAKKRQQQSTLQL